MHKTCYAEFCKLTAVPPHLQPWWLDAVCGPQHWNVCLAADGNGRTIAALPYYIRRRMGLKVIQQPPLSSYGGPWLLYPARSGIKGYNRYGFEKKIFEELIRQLPEVALFQQNFYPDIENWLPFCWAGFCQTTRYTYTFESIDDPEKIRAGFKNTLRTDLKKAEQAVTVFCETDSAALLYGLHEQSFARKNTRPPYTFDTFNRLHRALVERGQSRCYIARDRQTSAAHAGLYLVFDETRAYVLLTGTDPVFKKSSAVWLLFWQAILFCAEKGIGLDFEGSMERDIERGFRAFGAPLVPYHRVWRAHNRLLDFALRFRM